MRILLVGAGGVGDAIAKVAATRSFYDIFIVSDNDFSRAEKTVEWIRNRHGAEVASKFLAAKLDASHAANVVDLARNHNVTHLINAVEPRFLPTIFSGAYTAGVNYIDLAMSVSEPHEADPYHLPGIKIGDAQYALSEQWERSGKLALVGMGAQPGLANVFARYAQDYLFSEINEVSVKDGDNLEILDERGNRMFAPAFSIWKTIEECLNPPLVYERNRGWFTTEPFSEPEIFEFPEGIGSVECVNVEHEEVAMLPRHIAANRVSYKYGLGAEFISILKVLHKLGLDQTRPIRVRSAQGPVEVSPRDMVAAVLPDPASLGPQMTGKTCAGVLVTGKDKDGRDRATYLYHVADNSQTMAELDAQCVVARTAYNPVIALELIAEGIWKGAGVLGPEAFDAKPFLDLMSSTVGYNQPWIAQERLPASPLRHP